MRQSPRFVPQLRRSVGGLTDSTETTRRRPVRSTLFFIPHTIGPLPVFGWGWAATALLTIWIVGRIWLLRTRPAGQTVADVLTGSLFGWLTAAAVIIWVIPLLEAQVILGDGRHVTAGLPIRGYGVMLLLGVVAATFWTYRRGRRFGLDADRLLSLATWGMIGGIGGARLFYVVQKWDELRGDAVPEKLLEALRFTEGGLVVYGGVIGGLAATLAWCFAQKWSFLLLADVVTPPFLVGLAVGRVGCLLNGCCFGGVCEVPLPAIHFPNGSPPYFDQLQSGRLIGVRFAASTAPSPAGRRIAAVEPGGWADMHGVEAGFQIRFGERYDEEHLARPPTLYAIVKPPGEAERGVPLPASSVAVHPAQVYATIDAAILAGLLGTLAIDRRRRGRVFGWGLLLYGVSRFLEEYVRVDEAGQFGTSLSIGQWVSLGVVLAGVCLLFWVRWADSRNARFQL